MQELSTTPPFPLISVVIPTFNRPDLLLRRGLSSALGQRYPHLEVLVVTDGPDPLTEAALAGVTDSRIRRLALPENRGPADARNLGVRESRGKWIAFLDDDDEWRPEKLARQLEWALRSSHKFPVVFGSYIGRTPHGDRLHPARLKAPSEPLGNYMLVDPDCALMCSMIFAPRELLLRVPFTPGRRIHEDWDWMLLAEQTPGVGFEQLPREDTSALTIYYSGENRPAGSRHWPWRNSLDWAQAHRRAGRLSDRAFAGFIVFQLAPRAVEAGEWSGLPVLAAALLSSRPTPSEVLRFLKHWAIPLRLRRRVRAWLNTRAQPVRLEG